jgi:O-antigen ligase
MYTSVDVKNWERVRDGASEAKEGREDPLLRLDEPARRPISVNPGRTRGRFVQVGALVALFFMVARWADERRIVSILKAVTVVGFLVAVFGLVQLLTWNGKIYWVRKVPSVSATMPTAFGPFVNHDHFAGYIEMIIPVALSLAFWLVDKRRTPAPPASPAPEEGGWTAALRTGPPEERGRLSQGTLATFVAVILIVSLFFSLSRGGILSAFISGSILLVLLCRRIASRRVRALVAVALPAVVVSMIALIGAEAVRKQMGTYANLSGEASFRLRAIIWERLVRELPAYAWVGAGLGTFEDSFAPLTPAGSLRRWDKAHNDYLHLVWETGVAGGLLFVLGAAAFIRRFWWPALRGRARPVELFGVGMAISLLSIALHSAVDFSLQIGANGFLCSLLAGLIVALQKADGTFPSGRAAVRAVDSL